MKAINTSPLTIGQYPNEKRLTRRFLGNHNPEYPVEHKELKAYLKGNTHYQYKKDETGNPLTFKVKQEYFYL